MSIDNEQERAAQARPRIRLAAVMALALAAAFVAWLFVRGDDSPQPVTSGTPELATLADLVAAAQSADGPVYWAGPRAGVQYEFSQSDGRVHIRYLPPDVEVGDPEADYLTVGTYSVENALAATRATGDAEGGVARDLPGGGIAVYNENRPTNVYVAFPGIDRQVEVYDPSPGTARQLAYSGAIVPIATDESTPEERGEPVAAALAELNGMAAEVDHPVYWTGPKPGFTYELTRLPNGEIYIRYLPEDVEIGDHRPDYETVGTYPVENALAAIEQEATAATAVTFDLPMGGKAYYDRSAPASVYFALPDSNVQVEVFHPTAGEAERLVRGGRVTPIR